MIPEDINELVEEYMPVIQAILPKLKMLGGELMPLMEDLTDTMVDLQLRALDRYMNKGLRFDDAMKLVLSHKIALIDLANNKRNK